MNLKNKAEQAIKKEAEKQGVEVAGISWAFGSLKIALTDGREYSFKYGYGAVKGRTGGKMAVMLHTYAGNGQWAKISIPDLINKIKEHNV